MKISLHVIWHISQKHRRNYHVLGDRNNGTCMMISAGLLGQFLCGDSCGLYLDFHVLVVISGLCVVVNSPIDSENRKLEENEINQYRHITYSLIIITTVLYFVLLTLKQSHYALCLAVSLALIAILQLPCIVKKKK